MPANYASSWGIFSNNGGYGLNIKSNGTVLVSNVNVNLMGIPFCSENRQPYCFLTKAVTFQNSIFNDNQAVSGIIVLSKGTATVTKIEVNSTKVHTLKVEAPLKLNNSIDPFAAANVLLRQLYSSIKVEMGY